MSRNSKEEKKEIHKEVKCLECGKSFIRKSRNNMFCCRKCQLRYNNKHKSEKKLHEMECRWCHKKFITYSKNARYCCTQCRLASNARKCRKHGLDRPFSEITPYLIHKYYQEGMPPKEIASILRRNIQSIEKALETPLKPEEQKSVDYYFHKYVKRK